MFETPDVVLSDLDAVLDRVTGINLAGLGRAELRDVVCRLQTVQARVNAFTQTATAEADSACVQVDDSLARIGDAIALHSNAQARKVGYDLRLGRFLMKFPTLQAAAIDGILTTEHVRALRNIHNTRTHDAMHNAQDYLIDIARDGGWREFEITLGYWKLAFDPDGKEPQEQARKRGLDLERIDGMTRGRFELDPVDGAEFKNAIEDEAERLRRQDLDSGTERTSRQRRADALVNLIRRGAGAKNPAKPLIHLVMSARVFEDWVTTGTVDLDVDDVDGRCETVDGTPIHPQRVMETLLRAEIRRLVLGPDNEILNLGRSARCYPPHLKAAIIAAARGRCATPGCHADTRWLQADHIHPWHHGGQTDTKNAQPMCGHNNGHKSDTPPPPQRE